MLKNVQRQNNQSGRSLLEILMVLAVIGVLTVGGLGLYRKAIAIHEANLIYEDILTQGEAVRHRGSATNKNIYDSTIGKKSRSGRDMTFCPENRAGDSCPVQGVKTFGIKVSDITPESCATLKGKEWPLDVVARVKIGNKAYHPLEINCEGIEDKFDLTAVFWSNHVTASERRDSSSILPSLCSAEGTCLSCQTCQNNVCVNTCPSGEFCTKTTANPDGECQPCPAPTEGTYCGDTPTGVCDARGCCKKTKIECNWIHQDCINNRCVDM